MQTNSVVKTEIQRLVALRLRADWVRHIILRIESPPRARRFVSALYSGKFVSDAEDHDGNDPRPLPWYLNISFTFLGLERIGLNEKILNNVLPKLAEPFVQGASRRAQALGDIGTSAAHNWDQSFEPDNANMVLTVYGKHADSGSNSEADWLDIISILKGLDGADGLDGWDNIELATKRDRGNEVFGFKDGISQPYFRGVSTQPVSKIPESLKFEPGDLLLGYENSYGENFWNEKLLPDEATGFFKNGTFGALRKIKQDKRKFVSETEIMAKNNGLSPELIRAKIFGRWPNGAVVKPGEDEQPDTSPESENDFDFSDDKHGYGCPFGAHIRRINHRDTKDVFPFRHRAIQRRGLPYGEAGGDDEGLLALFICSSLDSQFEFVLKDWVDGAPRMHSGDGAVGSDPIIGNKCNDVKMFDIPREKTESIRLTGLSQYATTKGMLYLFFPSLNALRRMSILQEADNDFIYSKRNNLG